MRAGTRGGWAAARPIANDRNGKRPNRERLIQRSIEILLSIQEGEDVAEYEAADPQDEKAEREPAHSVSNMLSREQEEDERREQGEQGNEHLETRLRSGGENDEPGR